MTGKDGRPWTTLFRTPQMHAPSGAWLEAFSKWDAQAMLMAVPWTILAASLTFFITIYAVEVTVPSLLPLLEKVVAVVQYFVAISAGLYLPVALVLERPSSCCWKSGPRRPAEGWLCLLAVAACSVIALTYARSSHSLPDRSRRITFIHGSAAFRMAATAEFLLQIGWLWSAAGLRCEEGMTVPRWRRWSYLLLTMLWMFTWWGPTDHGRHASMADHAMVLVGYTSRVILFVYCVTRACRKCTRHCQCVCFCALCRDDWRCLENLPCTPGRPRLRYLLYYLLTRPPFLIIMNLPLGYPLALGASLALVLRCSLILLIAVALRPAPASSVKEHRLEVDTREKFDLLLALRLCDFSCETYLGTPMPAVVIVSGSSHSVLNGKYKQDGRDKDDHPQYLQQTSQARLRYSEGTWEVSWAPRGVADPHVRAFVQDEARSPDQVDGLWFEVHGEEQVSSTSMRVSLPESELRRDWEVSGGCDQLDVQWLLAEHQGCLRQEEPEDVSPNEMGNERSSTGQEATKPKEVSLVVAFRGTQSVTNVATDVRISMVPLAEESTTGPFGSAEGQQPVCFDLRQKVLAKLEYLEQLRAAPTNPFSPVRAAHAEARAPLHVEPDEELQSDARHDVRDDGPDSILSGCCRFVTLCCTRLFFPFLPSDFEDDDEDLGLEALERVRVHRGFAEAYGAVRADILAQLKERLHYWHGKDAVVRVYATGHSLGGAIANLFALDLSAAPEDKARSFPFSEPVVVYTFGSPRAGNAAFRSIYNAFVPETYRVVASRDLVPTLPPSIAYRQLGREVWLDDAGELTFVMSWAMRHILPARDSIWYHAMLSYFRLLNRAYLRKTGRAFPSSFRGEHNVREALDGKPTSEIAN